MCRMVARIAEARNILSKRLGRLPTHDEISEVLNVHVLIVRLVSERNMPPISLDRAITDQGSITLQVIFLNFIYNLAFLKLHFFLKEDFFFQLLVHVSFLPTTY